jgi:integrase
MRSWGASTNTIRARRVFAMRCFEEWGGVPSVTKIQATMNHPEWSDWTRSTYHTHLKNLCEWLLQAGYLRSDPMAEIRSPSRPHSEPRPLSEAELARVLEVAEGRVRDWIDLALLAGLRVHEIAKIRGEDVTEEGLYVHGKGGKRTTLPIHPDLWEMAQRYPRTGYWFPSPQGGHLQANRVSDVVSKLFDELGIEGSIHRCRHSHATRLLRAGVNLRVVQKLMRHSSIQTTAGYTAVDEAEMTAAVRLLPGGSDTTDPL